MAREYLDHPTQSDVELAPEAVQQAGTSPSKHKILKLPGMKRLSWQTRPGPASPSQPLPRSNNPIQAESSELAMSPPLRKKSWRKVFRPSSGSNKATSRPVLNEPEPSDVGKQPNKEPPSAAPVPIAVTILLSNGNGQTGELSGRSSYCTVPSFEHSSDVRPTQGILQEFMSGPPSPMSEIVFQTQDDLEDVPEIPTPPVDAPSLHQVPLLTKPQEDRLDAEELTTLLHEVSSAHSDADTPSVFFQVAAQDYEPSPWQPTSPRARPAPVVHVSPRVASNSTRSADVPWFDYGLVLWAFMMSFLAGYLYSCAS
ncbi:hypothetical protein B0H21DRAFT_152663 [Amylocystis lapponica]|nr:hypothetical protein B0H21DRAFT_152663 [Amylocystis lapponica]